MKYSIIVPTKDHCEDLLKSCLESVKKYTKLSEVEVIVVANGCTDKTAEYVNSLGKPFKLIWSDAALGYTKAANLGIDSAQGDYIVFLNNDTVLLNQNPNDWLETMARPFADGNVGVSGPSKITCKATGVSFIIFFCAMTSRKVIDKIGKLDEIFSPGFGEDIDFAAKCYRAGLRVVQVPSEKALEYRPEFRVGSFPLYHAAERTVHELPQWADIIERNNATLVKRYCSTKVHVVTPTCGRVNKLRRMLDSVLKQTYPNIQVHVCYDGPADSDTVNLLKEYPEVLFYQTTKREKACGGEPRIHILDRIPLDGSVCFVDDDNEIYPEFVATHVQQLDAGNAVSIVPIFHDNLNRVVPDPATTTINFGDIDSLNFMVNAALAKVYAKLWKHDPSKPVTHDYDVVKACAEHARVAWYKNSVLGRHGQTLRIRVSAVCKNEAKLLPFFIEYYSRFADVEIYDGRSTDGSDVIARSMGAKVHQVDEGSQMNHDILMPLRNNCWKAGRWDYDWQIVCDVDEFLYHPQLLKKLEEYSQQGVTIPRIAGYDMITETFPARGKLITDQVRLGVRDERWLDKLIIFNPQKVDINYEMGCHTAKPTGQVKYSEEKELKMLHHRWLSLDYVREKAAYNNSRLSDADIDKGVAFHYKLQAVTSPEQFAEKMAQASDVFDSKPKENKREYLIAQSEGIWREHFDWNVYRISEADIAGKTVIDLGGHFGFFALKAHDLGARQVLSVEANPMNYMQYLRNTVAIPSIKAINAAVSHKTGDYVTISLQLADSRCSLVGEVTGTQVVTVDIRDVTSIFNVNDPLVLKMDIEGAEHAIFENVPLTFFRRFELILIELHGETISGAGRTMDKIEKQIASVGFGMAWKGSFLNGKDSYNQEVAVYKFVRIG